MAKATHQGECQICGSTQKLPKGVLSLHGYDVRYHFFNGVCAGAKHLPFEQSKDLIAGHVARVTETANELETESQSWKDGRMIDGNKAWYRVYNRRLATYSWMQVEIFAEEFKSSVVDHTILLFNWINPHDNRKERLNFTGFPKTIDEARKSLNVSYAGHLDHQIRGMRQYCKWQEERMQNWTIKPLKAIGE